MAKRLLTVVRLNANQLTERKNKMNKVILASVVGSIVAAIVLFVMLVAHLGSYGSFAVVDADNKEQFTMPFTTQSTADAAAALKDCGQGCKAVRVVRVQ